MKSVKLIAICLVLVTSSVRVAYGADAKITIVQTFPSTTMVNGRKTLVVQKDTDCIMACQVGRRPPGATIHWLIQNHDTDTNIPVSADTDSQQPFKYQIDKPSRTLWRLKVKSIQPSDQALYICRVQLGPQQMVNDSRVISVVQSPIIVDIMTSSDLVVEEGDKVRLTCGASGIPSPVLSWKLLGDGVLPSGGREFSSPSLFIEEVDRQHMGSYQCVAQNVAGTDKRKIYLRVKFAPQIIQKKQEVFQAIGYSKELQCEASGSPVPTGQQILWYKDGIPLEDIKKYSFKNFTGSNYILMKLVINDVTESDYGEYRCYAENSEGNGQNFIRLSQSQSFVGDGPNTNKAAILSGQPLSLILCGLTMYSLIW